MSDADLELQDDAGNTAFFLAVIAGRVDCFDVMMKIKPKLAITRGVNHELPLYVAASRGYSKIARRLYDATKSKSDWEYDDKFNILIALVYYNIYDVALDMLQEDNRLALTENVNKETALLVLARKSSLTAYIASRNEPTDTRTWKNFICQGYRQVRDFMHEYEEKIMPKKAFQLMKCIWKIVMELDDEMFSKFSPTIFAAAENGNAEFFTILFLYYPKWMLNVDSYGYTIFHTAVMSRQEDIFRSIQDLYPVTEKISRWKNHKGNNILHLAAKLPFVVSRLQVVSTAVLQLQRELQWFEEVKKVVALISCLEEKNDEGKTPDDVFVESHKQMMEEGEKWMKGTANKCILVATLIATLVFQAVFNLPNQTAGDPISVSIAFYLFFVVDAVSLVLAVASVMVFLGIITSRTQLYDFQRSLPRKLMGGIATLFISLVAMLAAFCLVVLLSFGGKYGFFNRLETQRFGFPLIVIGTTPIILFIRMQLGLFTKIYKQTYHPDFILKPNKLMYKTL